MRGLVLSLAVGLVSLSLIGCQTSPGGAAPAGSAGAKPGGGSEQKADAKVVTIAKLGLKGLAPGETEDPIVGTGDPILIMAGAFTLNVSAAKPTDPKTIKQGQDAAQMLNPKGMKTETLPDGWALTFENTGSLGTNYIVNVRREIGGTGYLCETMQSTPEQQAKALAFCKSLSKQ